MKNCKVNVEKEFAQKVSDQDAIFDAIVKNNQIEYLKVLNDIVKRKEKCSKYKIEGRHYLQKRLGTPSVKAVKESPPERMETIPEDEESPSE